jgi:hypothetical protein
VREWVERSIVIIFVASDEDIRAFLDDGDDGGEVSTTSVAVATRLGMSRSSRWPLGEDVALATRSESRGTRPSS